MSEVALDQISYIDYPELKINKHESTQMPFRYVMDENGKPIMPKVSLRPQNNSQHNGKLLMTH